MTNSIYDCNELIFARCFDLMMHPNRFIVEQMGFPPARSNPSCPNCQDIFEVKKP